MKFIIVLQGPVKVKAYSEAALCSEAYPIDHELPEGFTFTVQSDPMTELVRALQRKS